MKRQHSSGQSSMHAGHRRSYSSRVDILAFCIASTAPTSGSRMKGTGMWLALHTSCFGLLLLDVLIFGEDILTGLVFVLAVSLLRFRDVLPESSPCGQKPFVHGMCKTNCKTNCYLHVNPSGPHTIRVPIFQQIKNLNKAQDLSSLSRSWKSAIIQPKKSLIHYANQRSN